MKQFLAISAIGKDRPGLAHEVVRTIADCGASIHESRVLPLGGELAMQILAAGNWHAVARVESELARLAEAGGLPCSCGAPSRAPCARTTSPTPST